MYSAIRFLQILLAGARTEPAAAPSVQPLMGIGI